MEPSLSPMLSSRDSHYKMSFEEWKRRKEEKAALVKAKLREKAEGKRCKKCGWIGASCICQLGLNEYKEFGGPIDLEEVLRNQEVARLKKLDREGRLVSTLLKEAENGTAEKDF